MPKTVENLGGGGRLAELKYNFDLQPWRVKLC